MALDQDTLLALAGIAVGLLIGLVATLLQIRDGSEAWNLLSRKPVATVPGSRSSVAVLVVGFALLLVGMTLASNLVVIIGAAAFGFGAVRYLFRYYRPL